MAAPQLAAGRAGQPAGQKQQQQQQRPSYSAAAHKSRKPSQSSVSAPNGASPTPAVVGNGQTNGNLSAASSENPNMSNANMNDRMIFLLMGLVGSTVTVTCKSGPRLQGILSSAQTQGELGIVLKRVRNVADDKEVLNECLIIQGKDIVDVSATSVDLHERVTALPPPVQGQKGPDTFRTDADITGNADGTSDGRQLIRWADEMDEVSPTFGNSTNNALESNRPSQWDQFATNEKRFGARTNYNEEIYTTRLDRTTSDFKERERKAAAIAQQILSGTSANAHIAEERNQTVAEHSTMDEEDKYSGVIRTTNAYVPPAMRKTMTAGGSNASKSALGPTAPGLTRLPSRGAGPSTAGASPAPGAPANAATGKNEALLETFKSFVTEEHKRLEPKRATAITKAKDSKLAELKNFAASFKLPTAMSVPTDIIPLLGNNEKKQKDSLPSSLTAAQNGGSASSNVTPRLGEAQLSTPRVMSPASDASKASSLKKAFALPAIPSFKDLQASKVAKTSSPASSEVRPAAAASSSKINAAAKEFKPNPNAAAFTPGGVPRSGNETPTQKLPQAHPFFGNKTNLNPHLMHVKEDFSPFSAGHPPVPDPSSIPPNWPFNGRSYKSIFVPVVTSPPSNPENIPQNHGEISQNPMLQGVSAQSAASPAPQGMHPGPPPHNMPVATGQPPVFYYPPNYRYPQGPFPNMGPPNAMVYPQGFPPPFSPNAGMYPPNVNVNVPSNYGPSTPGMFPPMHRHPSMSGPATTPGHAASPPPPQGYYQSPASPPQHARLPLVYDHRKAPIHNQSGPYHPSANAPSLPLPQQTATSPR